MNARSQIIQNLLLFGWGESESDQESPSGPPAPASPSVTSAALAKVSSGVGPETRGAGLQAWLAGEGITLGKALAVNPETGCRSHLGTVEVEGHSQPCVVKVYDSAFLGELLGDERSAEKAWRTESEVLRSCSAGHEELSEPWRLSRLIKSIAAQGVFCNVIEYVEGETLDKRLERGKLSEVEAWQVLLEGMRALEVLHARGYVHRDVRPANLVMRPDGSAALIDVNTAHEAGRTSYTMLKEQDWHVIPPDAGWRDTPPDTDVYALGAIVMGGVLGRAPMELLRRESPQGYLDLSLLEGAELSEGLKAALRRICTTEHTVRPQANDAEISALEKLQRGEGTELAPLASATGLARLIDRPVRRGWPGRVILLSHAWPQGVKKEDLPPNMEADLEVLNAWREVDFNDTRAEMLPKVGEFAKHFRSEYGPAAVSLWWSSEF
jgi:serine/threonine protein kinase